jgi:hypothetical protein
MNKKLIMAAFLAFVSTHVYADTTVYNITNHRDKPLIFWTVQTSCSTLIGAPSSPIAPGQTGQIKFDNKCTSTSPEQYFTYAEGGNSSVSVYFTIEYTNFNGKFFLYQATGLWVSPTSGTAGSTVSLTAG